MKNLTIKKIMSIAFFEYLRKNTYKTKLVVSYNAQQDVVSNCFQLYGFISQIVHYMFRNCFCSLICTFALSF